MVNAIFDEYQSSSGSASGSGSGVDVNGNLKSITTEQFELIDTSDNGIVLAISKLDGCDINTETTIQPTSDQSTALVVNNSSGVALAIISDSSGLLTSKPIGMIVNNNSTLVDQHYLSGAELNVIGAAPNLSGSLNKTYRSRVTIGTKAFNYVTGSAIDTTATGIMVQGGNSGDVGGAGAVIVSWGSISAICPALVSQTPVTREFMRFQMTSDYTTKMVGINIYNPTAALHVKNTTASQTLLALDGATGTRQCTVDNSGNTTVGGNLTVSGTGSSTISGNLTVNGTSSFNSNLTLQTTYLSNPTQYQLGYLKEFKNATAVAMAATTCTTLCSMDVPPGIWMIMGVAELMPSATATFVQAAIVPSTATVNTFDDFTQMAQFTSNSNNGIIISLPMRYYCGSVTKTFEVRALCAGCTATGNHGTGYSSVLRAVRVG